MRFTASLALIVCLLCRGADAPAHHATKADIEKWMTELSNWGRWGKNDQIGTANLITPAKRREAAALVKDGDAISLAHDALMEKAPDNPDPFIRKMLYTGAHPNGDWFMDQYTVLFHGLAHTHMDSLAHTAWHGKMYNGFPQLDVTEQGAQELAITGYKNGFFTRGILMDIPRLKGVPWLEPGVAIYPEDLEAWEKKAGVKIGSGDVVLDPNGTLGAPRGKRSMGHIPCCRTARLVHAVAQKA